jgi:PAS domain S-box-containing protein
MADKVPVMIWVTDPQGQCSYLNKPLVRVYGTNPNASPGTGLDQRYPSRRCQPQSGSFSFGYPRTDPFHQLYRLGSKAGTYRWFLDKGEPRYDEQGNFEGFVGVVIDVHEQHQAEERLQLSVKAGKVGLFEWDVVRNRATYSDLLLELFGLEAGTFGGEFDNAYQVYQRVIHPQDRQQVNEQVEKALSTGETEFYVEFRVVRPGGESPGLPNAER